MTGWIAKTKMARSSFDVICDPVWAILGVHAFQNVTQEVYEGHSTPEVKGSWLLHQIERSNVEEEDEGRLSQV